MANSEETINVHVLDTNVLIHDPDCIYNFAEHDVVIPLVCIEELDKLKMRDPDVAKKSRMASRRIEALREQAVVEGKLLTEGVSLGEGKGKLTLFGGKLEETLGISLTGSHGADNTCMQVTKHFMDKGRTAKLVTKDVNLRIRANGHGIVSNDYTFDKKGDSIRDLFAKGGVVKREVHSGIIDRLYEAGPLEPVELGVELDDVMLNQGMVLSAGSQSALARYLGNGMARRLFDPNKTNIANVKPKNKEQHFALDALIDPNYRVLSLLGKAGTGKTFLALAAGIQHAVNENKYRRMHVIRPMSTVGDRDIGYRPGGFGEKTHHYMLPIHDNLEQLFAPYAENDDLDMGARSAYQMQIDAGLIDLDVTIYARGRSLPRVLMLIDEAQNLTPHEVKTLVTRIGKGSKVVLVGDPYQIDNRFLDEESNGLTYITRRLMGREAFFAAEFMVKSERDPVVDRLADLL